MADEIPEELKGKNRLILTPNKKEMCGMFQLAKDMNGTIRTKADVAQIINWKAYDEVITFLYPMHKYGKVAQKHGVIWICYDQKIPPITKQMFPNFYRRQYMRVFKILNERSMKGADEYWELSKVSQKPRWTEKSIFKSYPEKYAIYLGRTTDYKNFVWLQKLMIELDIPLYHPENEPDYVIHRWLSGAYMLVTASLWEGYGRPVMEAQSLGIPVVCYDVGVHKKLVTNGIVVPVGNEQLFKEAIIKIWKG